MGGTKLEGSIDYSPNSGDLAMLCINIGLNFIEAAQGRKERYKPHLARCGTKESVLVEFLDDQDRIKSLIN